MMIDLHAKIQLSICKLLGKKCGKLFDQLNLLSPRPVISPKSIERNETQNQSASHGD